MLISFMSSLWVVLVNHSFLINANNVCS